MNRTRIEALLATALERLAESGTLPEIELGSMAVEKARIPDADYSSTLALRLASAVNQPPRSIAEKIIGALPDHPMIGSVSIAGPGFVNFVLDPAWIAGQVEAIISSDAGFGNTASLSGRRIQVEFVSVNPTGPLTVGHGRSAVIGDVLARLLQAAGAIVEREYYINDAGNQVRMLGLSLRHQYRLRHGFESQAPSAGYRGAYVADWAAEIDWPPEEIAELSEPEQVERFTDWGVARALAEIKAHLAPLDIEFDSWYSESRLHADGAVTAAIQALKQRGFVQEREDAVWFAHGEDQSQANVLVKRTGEPTYLAADVAYHCDKLQLREFDTAIDIVGADHHGHTARMKAALGALGIDPERLTYVLCQIVHVVVDGEPVRQSKRAGDFELLVQLLDDVGADAVRYFMLSRDPNSQMEFDLDLARRQSDENPVHKIRYAHARIASILRRAGEQGLAPDIALLSLITEPEEIAIVKRMLELPEVVDMAATNFEPHRLAHYSLALASEFNSLYHRHRVISEDQRLSRARLALTRAVGITLARSLELMGIEAPQFMQREAGST
ncbi:MAG: arginine--tRNA ligase [Chloroflexi bacterium]|nr:arginine--tRNA ligase [Chloroflexota bacterium]MDE2701610.1 arginine--tRNA ligase [Chloroflexota bacterium]MDE2862392.1 arginine--tRNA ligase [Chloroflexota bacterium]MXY00970.1 arginine--tRNA ligase [Chloroflexota bacterium]MYB16016.1 arginine--tRNA ligase [Chloroflexota bacterium]